MGKQSTLYKIQVENKKPKQTNDPVTTKIKGKQKMKTENDPVPTKLKGKQKRKMENDPVSKIQGENLGKTKYGNRKWSSPTKIKGRAKE